MDSVRGFKDKWYVLQPVTQTALDSIYEEETAVVDENGEPVMDAEGRPAMGRVSKFPLHWCSGHYDHGMGVLSYSRGEHECRGRRSLRYPLQVCRRLFPCPVGHERGGRYP